MANSKLLKVTTQATFYQWLTTGESYVEKETTVEKLTSSLDTSDFWGTLLAIARGENRVALTGKDGRDNFARLYGTHSTPYLSIGYPALLGAYVSRVFLLGFVQILDTIVYLPSTITTTVQLGLEYLYKNLGASLGFFGNTRTIPVYILPFVFVVFLALGLLGTASRILSFITKSICDGFGFLLNIVNIPLAITHGIFTSVLKFFANEGQFSDYNNIWKGVWIDIVRPFSLKFSTVLLDNLLVDKSFAANKKYTPLPPFPWRTFVSYGIALGLTLFLGGVTGGFGFIAIPFIPWVTQFIVGLMISGGSISAAIAATKVAFEFTLVTGPIFAAVTAGIFGAIGSLFNNTFKTLTTWMGLKESKKEVITSNILRPDEPEITTAEVTDSAKLEPVIIQTSLKATSKSKQQGKQARVFQDNIKAWEKELKNELNKPEVNFDDLEALNENLISAYQKQQDDLLENDIKPKLIEADKNNTIPNIENVEQALKAASEAITYSHQAGVYKDDIIAIQTEAVLQNKLKLVNIPSLIHEAYKALTATETKLENIKALEQKELQQKEPSEAGKEIISLAKEVAVTANEIAKLNIEIARYAILSYKKTEEKREELHEKFEQELDTKAKTGDENRETINEEATPTPPGYEEPTTTLNHVTPIQTGDTHKKKPGSNA